ncbi:hypothetical protein HNP38_000116 [Chryseobacterium defluvii]|uniref:Uncharacterized protein n=1 Tax=Chryseobacterium defluvii TaxID=160396 RepID=A0A840KAJ5_9FLAO|nr:hypothetical protein [Chryseobacterium defluvii]MBB4804844.1 hypothetical protein [Chryseobacterium defluvii]
MNSKIIFFSIILACCSGKKTDENVNTKNNSKAEIKQKSNVTTEISTDINQLEKLINLSEVRPEKVKFKYTFIDNSKGRVPGPSDSFLEAVLYFDDATMEKIKSFDKNADFPNTGFQKKDFKFNWLDKEILTELENSGPEKTARPDFVFGTENGMCWYLKNKILFIKRTT